jgi:uncharacterized membrane protein YedE/YeeE
MNAPAARTLAALIVLLLIAVWAWYLSADPSARGLTFSLLAGAAFGIILQRARFCFLCNFRDFVERREPRGVVAIIVALAAGTVLYTVVTMAWLPVPAPGSLPPNAHIGPVSPFLALAAFVFGLGMAISGSCLSGHFYRLGEGSPTSPFAIVGAGAGFFIGFLTWNPIWLSGISESRVVWLPHYLGYAGALAIALILCAVLLIAVVAFGTPAAADTNPRDGVNGLLRRIFIDRWPPVVGGLAIGALSAFYFLRVAPLGVTAELGSIVRTAGSSSGALPETLLGLDTLRGCATAVKQTLLSPNGLLVIGLILGSFSAALAAGQFKPAWPSGRQIVKGLAGGVLMGWGAMTALGCTVGVLLSGIHAGALSGWIFLVFCTLGVWIGLRGPAFLARRNTAARGA